MSNCVTGKLHTITLSDEGILYSFGRNNLGQLGIGNYYDISVPTCIPNLPKIKQVSCGANFSVCIDYEGSMWSFGSNENGQLGISQGFLSMSNTQTIHFRPQKITIPPVHSISN